jgi:hypothetical protein
MSVAVHRSSQSAHIAVAQPVAPARRLIVAELSEFYLPLDRASSICKLANWAKNEEGER